MKMYDVICPVCGRINHNLYLIETDLYRARTARHECHTHRARDGWYECEECGSILQDEDYCKNVRPIIWSSRFVQMDETRSKVTV